MKIQSGDCQNLDRALSLEWLETNGRGGFASGTVAGANTRRYHALLLTAREPSGERFALVNHLEEWVDLDGQIIPLSTNLYPGAVHPNGYTHGTGFSSVPWPTWTFDCRGVTVQREILCVRGRDLVIVRWRLERTTSKRGMLRVRPLLTGRGYHMTHHENEGLSPEAAIGSAWVAWQPYSDVPAVRAFHSGTYRHAPEWYRRLQFPIERQRGFDFEEDWWSPGEVQFVLEPGAEHTLVLTSETVDSLDATALAEGERTRREQVTQAEPTADSLTRGLWRAAHEYLAARGSRLTVIAGYPWFTDWGRDTFISLPGLCLVSGRYKVAWQIIEACAGYVSEGMVPNRFPDIGGQPEYNSIDASLWFVHAVDRYLTYSNDEERVRAVAWPAVKQIIDAYRRGTRYNIHMDRDGLIVGGDLGAQLTWMDAKVGDRVVTPRRGKPVEIQALWVRSLDIAARCAARFGESAYAVGCRRDRARATAAFREKFWYAAGGFLYDVIDGPEGNDASIRPNQIYAVALCDGLVTKRQAGQILRVVEDHLLTPVGLRTLSPGDDRYHPRYEGSANERDGAYHQGTVWPFLLGPFVTAWLKTFGKSAARRAECRSFLNGLGVQLQKCCVGHLSELFDGDAPHDPRGCPAQAWSVAEPLRALIEDLNLTTAVSTAGPNRRVVTRRKESARKAHPKKKRRST